MPETLAPMTGVAADKILSGQSYEIETINQNMFSAANKKGWKTMVQPTHLKGVTIQKLWNDVFSDASDFLKRYHDRRSETDLNVGSWNYASDMGSGYRFVSLVTLVDVPRAKTPTPLNEAHRWVLATTDEGKLLMTYQISSQTPNVPAGGSFRTEAYCEISADSSTSDCTIAFWGNCRKMSFAFSAIQYIATPRAIKEMSAAYQLMVDLIQEEFCGGLSGGNAKPAASTAPADTGGAVAAPRPSGSGSGSGGDGDGSGGPGSVFQGVLLVLALLITIALLRSMMAVNRAAGQAAHVSHSLSGLSGGSVASTSSLAGAYPQASAAAARTTLPLTEEQALMNAARDAQLQTLRYRWMEQRSTLTDIEASLATMRWMVYLQWILILAVSAKVTDAIRKYAQVMSKNSI